jgi:hypothetical protein
VGKTGSVRERLRLTRGHLGVAVRAAENGGRRATSAEEALSWFGGRVLGLRTREAKARGGGEVGRGRRGGGGLESRTLGSESGEAFGPCEVVTSRISGRSGPSLCKSSLHF